MYLATEQLWHDLKPSLQRFILNRVPDIQVADEILQESFLKILLHADQLKDETRLWSWAYRIVRHTISDHYRTDRREIELSEALALEEIDDDVQAEVATCLRPMLDCLPPKYRQALQLTELEEHSLQEAADLLGISLAAIKSQVRRGREQLKGIMLRYCHLEFDRYGHIINYRPRCPSPCDPACPCD
jgi:RNA polymerase sigma-70 factor, ECF subfamily